MPRRQVEMGEDDDSDSDETATMSNMSTSVRNSSSKGKGHLRTSTSVGAVEACEEDDDTSTSTDDSYSDSHSSDSEGDATATTANTSPTTSSSARRNTDGALKADVDIQNAARLCSQLNLIDTTCSRGSRGTCGREIRKKRTQPKPLRRLLRPDNVVALLHDFYEDLTINKSSKSQECWNALYEKYHSPEYQMLRPSGNPIDTQGFVGLFCSEEIVLHQLELVSVDDVQILAQGLVAIVLCTVDQTFVYRGELQQDRVTLTTVLEEVNGAIKIRHEHRSTGRPQPHATTTCTSSSAWNRWDEDQSNRS